MDKDYENFVKRMGSFEMDIDISSEEEEVVDELEELTQSAIEKTKGIKL